MIQTFRIFSYKTNLKFKIACILEMLRYIFIKSKNVFSAKNFLSHFICLFVVSFLLFIYILLSSFEQKRKLLKERKSFVPVSGSFVLRTLIIFAWFGNCPCAACAIELHSLHRSGWHNILLCSWMDVACKRIQSGTQDNGNEARALEEINTENSRATIQY